ncbi:unnamed protein product [Gadus morhua 'NCC']
MAVLSFSGYRPDPSPYGPPVGGPEPRRPSHYTLGTRTPELALPLGLDWRANPPRCANPHLEPHVTRPEDGL